MVRGRPFEKGHPKHGSRKKGSLKKATRAWKDFVTAVVSDTDNQQALVEAIRKWPELLFKVAEHAFGKPRQAVEVNQGEFQMIQWPDNQDIAEQ